MVKYAGSYLQCERPLCWNLRKSTSVTVKPLICNQQIKGILKQIGKAVMRCSADQYAATCFRLQTALTNMRLYVLDYELNELGALLLANSGATLKRPSSSCESTCDFQEICVDLQTPPIPQTGPKDIKDIDQKKDFTLFCCSCCLTGPYLLLSGRPGVGQHQHNEKQ